MLGLSTTTLLISFFFKLFISATEPHPILNKTKSAPTKTIKLSSRLPDNLHSGLCFATGSCCPTDWLRTCGAGMTGERHSAQGGVLTAINTSLTSVAFPLVQESSWCRRRQGQTTMTQTSRPPPRTAPPTAGGGGGRACAHVRACQRATERPRPGGHLDSESERRLSMLIRAPSARFPGAILDPGDSDDRACIHLSPVKAAREIWPPSWVRAW